MDACLVHHNITQDSGEGHEQYNAYKGWEVMNGIVVDDRKRIFTELGHSAHDHVIPLAQNKTHGWDRCISKT